MLGTLSFKQGLADGVLDGRGDIDELEKPNAKSAVHGTPCFNYGNFIRWYTSEKDEIVGDRSCSEDKFL